jgi:membrane protein implicated in regulation of membrane protease activity
MTEQQMTKRRAAVSIALNGLFLLIVGGALLAIVVLALGNVAAGAGVGGLIVIGLLAWIGWNTYKSRKR